MAMQRWHIIYKPIAEANSLTRFCNGSFLYYYREINGLLKVHHIHSHIWSFVWREWKGTKSPQSVIIVRDGEVKWLKPLPFRAIEE